MGYRFDNVVAYGITLRQVNIDDIEMVRAWRNSRNVSKHMMSQNKISKSSQREWFEGIDQRNEIHFIINFSGKDIGLISLKHINFREKSFEPALYIADQNLRNSHVPFLASLCLGDFVYNTLGLNNPKIYISDDNHKAIRYNTFLGFRPTDIVVKEKFRIYTLDEKAYDRTRSMLIKVLGS